MVLIPLMIILVVTVFFLLLSNNIKKCIPGIFIVYVAIIVFVVLLLKLLGYSTMDVLTDGTFLKSASYIFILMGLSYPIITLYLLHRFYQVNGSSTLKISKLLPNFMIYWLNSIKNIASSTKWGGIT